jgi:perosamine synthetase
MTSIATQSSALIAALTEVTGDPPRPVALHEPFLTGNEKQYVSHCIEDGWVSSVGSFVTRFENDLAKICGTAHAVATVNGTCALHISLVACGVRPGDEVLCPSLTFVATANAIAHAGAVPHFVDVEETSLGIDPEMLERYLTKIVSLKDGVAINKQTGRTIRALVPVHVFGHPCQRKALQTIASSYGFAFVEDATEALGSRETEGHPVGSSGIAVLSFNGNKIITTGGGGAVLVNDDILHARLKHLTTTAKTPHPWAFEHDAVAWNYRLPNINAALGCAQLEQLDTFVSAKRALAKRYQQAIDTLPGLRILPEPNGTHSNYWLVSLIADHSTPQWLHDMLQALHDAGFLCRPVWKPLHQLPMYRDCPRSSLARTENIAYRIINLPSSVRLGLSLLDGRSA